MTGRADAARLADAVAAFIDLNPTNPATAGPIASDPVWHHPPPRPVVATKAPQIPHP